MPRACAHTAQVLSARPLHAAAPDHPLALPDPHQDDAACLACGRQVLTDTRRHVLDLTTRTWRRLMGGSRFPTVCAVCRDEHGCRVPAPCPTVQVMDTATC